ncbi:TonB-dependent receptor [Sphingobacterium gobiense]|nr:TonB-dependent receptor [Sphingobacterium gobiense]
MKLTGILLFFFGMHLSAHTLAQHVTLQARNSSLKSVFKELNKQTGYYFIYNENLVKRTKSIAIDVKSAPLSSVLDEISSNLGLTYTLQGKTIILEANAAKVATPASRPQQETVTINGVVYDTQEPPMPLAGVNVMVKGTVENTTTDESGFFSVNAKKGDVLVFTMVGFYPREHRVTKNERSLPIALKSDVAALDEVVVVGMNEQQKKHIASSLSTLPIESNIAGKPITNLSQALQGGVTGIQVSQGSGLPGGDAATVYIRGITTLNSANPLVLVDGIPMDMNHIDPVTVESVTVLKDAAAASIYGSRAANGVIVVTTKRGTPGKMRVNYDGYYGYQTPTALPQTVDAVRYMEMDNEAHLAAGQGAPHADVAIEETRRGADPLMYPNTNWVDLMLDKMAPISSHSLSVSGGNSLARFAVTGNYMDQGSMLPNTNVKRFNIRANTTVTLADNFLVNLDFTAIKRNRELANRATSGGTFRLLEDLYRVAPNVLPRFPDRDGRRFYGQFADIVNPLAYAEVGGVRKNEYTESLINFRPKWTVLPGLNVNGQFSFRLNSDAHHNVRENFNHFDYYTGVLLRTWGLQREASQSRSTYYFVGLNADYTFNRDKHSVYSILGYSQEQRNQGDWTIFALRSAYTKLNYSYDDRFLLEGTVRMDGSSRFGPGKKYGFFPSVAVGWNLHNESFLNESTIVNNLKLRASYGSLGNENIDPYLYQSLISPTTALEVTHGNPDISWEKVDMLNVGFDLGLFASNKLELTVDFYDKRTNGMLLQPQLPLTGGFQAKVPVNAGEVQNRGWEASLTYTERLDNGFGFSLRPGITYNKNEILSLVGGPYESSGGDVRNQVGSSIGSLFGYRTDGLLQADDFDDNGAPLIPVRSVESAPGDIKYIDLNQDGQIDEADKTIIGDPMPRINFFSNFRFDYKNFDLEFLLQGTGKSDAMLTGMFALPLDRSADGGVPTTYYADNYWAPNRTDARFPRLNASPGDNRMASDFWFQNAAYVRVKFIQLGYTLNSQMANRLKLSGLRVFLNAQNPMTFTSVKLVDPESRGDQWKHSIMATYSVGASIRF